MNKQIDGKLLVRMVDAVEGKMEGKKLLYNIPHTQLIFCESGSGQIISSDGGEYSFKAGDMLYIDAALLCAVRTDGEAVSVRKIYCDTEAASGLINYFERGRLHLCADCGQEILRVYDRLFYETKELTPPPADESDEELAAASERKKELLENKEISLSLYRLIIMIGQEIYDRCQNTDGVLRSMAEPYKEFMFKKFKAHDKFEPAPEADALIRRLYGMGAVEYNEYMRLERGRSMIVFHFEFDEVARHLGFNSEGDFVRRFRETFNINPHEFRRLYV